MKKMGEITSKELRRREEVKNIMEKELNFPKELRKIIEEYEREDIKRLKMFYEITRYGWARPKAYIKDPHCESLSLLVITKDKTIRCFVMEKDDEEFIWYSYYIFPGNEDDKFEEINIWPSRIKRIKWTWGDDVEKTWSEGVKMREIMVKVYQNWSGDWEELGSKNGDE